MSHTVSHKHRQTVKLVLYLTAPVCLFYSHKRVYTSNLRLSPSSSSSIRLYLHRTCVNNRLVRSGQKKNDETIPVQISALSGFHHISGDGSPTFPLPLWAHPLWKC